MRMEILFHGQEIGAFEPVLLRDSGECLVPGLVRCGLVTGD
jgi:hypothetical protein